MKILIFGLPGSGKTTLAKPLAELLGGAHINADAVREKYEGFDKSKWKDATDEQKEALREKMRAARKEWEVLAKKHREEVRKRMVEIRKEFANKRDKVIDGNKPGD